MGSLKPPKPPPTTPVNAARKAPQPLTLSLLRNGIDFVQAAVILLYSNANLPLLKHKYAVLHIFSGALLLLKERLSREHRSLIWAEIKDVDDQGKKTVDFDECLNRLHRIANVKLDDSQRKLLRRAQEHRNRIEHYAIDLNPHLAETLVAEMVEFIFVFMRDELNENLENDLPSDAWGKVQRLRQVAQRLQQEEEEKEKKRLSSAERRYRKTIKNLSPHDSDWMEKAHQYISMPSVELEALADQTWWDRHDPPPQTPMRCRRCKADTAIIVLDDVAICTNPDCRHPHAVFNCKLCDRKNIRAANEGDSCEDCGEPF
ncbi:hypothetical protein HMI49_03900 [Corallococcus exercitus]|uniref:Uncharacterized protein n=1 Tax=Corallococcus exercitus TaxID=2316736 RepID=A0A7Y4KGM8_9BACT|nr:hypothetical protein [Corallococcus exercitus]NOK32344.1 hypothetical protein [Corallococcus exercitus]